MLNKRIKISAVYKDFQSGFVRLRKFDSQNQINFSAGQMRLNQLHLLTESIFFSTYREYENYIRDVFILYTQEKPTSKGKKVHSYLKPNNFSHAEALIQSSMQFLDWNSPETIVKRAELYLRGGYPIKLPYTSNLNSLREFKKIRNHIAHNSKESLDGYRNVLKSHFGTIPLNIPPVGEYLLYTSRANPIKYKLLEFFDLIETLSQLII